VSYQIEWKKFRKGYSFFVPCIDEKTAREELNRVAKRLKMDIVTKVILLDGIKGLRVWRV
jgi:hypothetical protein